MLRMIRTHLGWKLFISYVVIILIVVLVLASATGFSAPVAFDRHMAGMGARLAERLLGSIPTFQNDLFAGYQTSLTEAISFAVLAALIAAVAASYLISRQIVRPIQSMGAISQRIADGQYEQRLNITGDLTKDQLDELDQLALTFNQMADKLEKTEAVRRQLIGDVSHELRTPLAAIKGYMEGLMDGVLPANPETFQQVYTEADRLQRLVNDLQELSRMEAGAFQLELKAVAIAPLLEGVVNRLIRQYEEKGVNLQVDLPAGLPDVEADADRVTQVLTNLTGNALQFTPPGGTVRILAAHEKNEVKISVVDNGIGINAEHLAHLFDRFYRVDKSRTRASGGSGIGLTIARSLIRAHRGRIWAESQGEGKGSAFHFTLPAAV
jgi:signal transduction histidine kinase